MQTDFDDYNFLNSVRYARKIQYLSANMQNSVGFGHFCICIIDNKSADKYMLSNMPDWAIEYYKIGGYRSDKVFCKEFFHGKREFFPRLDVYDHIQQLLVEKEENIYGYFDLYALVRCCYECTFVLLAVDKENKIDVRKVYSQTYIAFEKFVVNFLCDMKEEIIDSCAFSDRLSLLYNEKYLNRVILTKEPTCNLTETEKKIFSCCKDQLAPKEIALKLNLSEKTVRNNFCSLKEKLKVYSTKDLCKEAFIQGF